jgi:polar amino acid transport system substrate-binding protein
MLPPDSPIQSVAGVDAAGHRIAVSARSAYDLWLTDNLRHAELVRANGLDESFELFVSNRLDALAGLRPKLIEDQQKLPGSRILDDSFTAVQQSIGCRPGRDKAAAFLKDFVERSKHNGFIASLISKHGVEGRLSVAPAIAGADG